MATIIRVSVATVCCGLMFKVVALYQRQTAEQYQGETYAALRQLSDNFLLRVEQESARLQQIFSGVTLNDLSDKHAIGAKLRVDVRDSLISTLYLILDEAPTGNSLSQRILVQSGEVLVGPAAITIDDSQELSALLPQLALHSRPFPLSDLQSRLLPKKASDDLLVVIPITLRVEGEDALSNPIRQDFLIASIDATDGFREIFHGRDEEGFFIEVSEVASGQRTTLFLTQSGKQLIRPQTVSDSIVALSKLLQIDITFEGRNGNRIFAPVLLAGIALIVFLVMLAEMISHLRFNITRQELSTKNTTLVSCLRRREREIEMLAGTAPYGIILFNRNGDARSFNLRARSLFGMDASTNSSTHWTELIESGDRARIKAEWEVLAKTPQLKEFIFAPKKGNVDVRVRLSLSPLESDSEFYGFIGFIGFIERDANASCETALSRVQDIQKTVSVDSKDEVAVGPDCSTGRSSRTRDSPPRAVLVVGEENEGREKIRDLARHVGMDCCFASNGAEASLLLERGSTSIIFVSSNLSHETLSHIQDANRKLASAATILTVVEPSSPGYQLPAGTIAFDRNASSEEFERLLANLGKE